jgi:hypothetical protein
MAISAQTVAMSEPHEIDYTLYFDSSTLKPAGGGGTPFIVYIAVAAVAAVIVLVTVLMVRKTGAIRRGKNAKRLNTKDFKI